MAEIDRETEYVVLTNPGDSQDWIPSAPNFQGRTFRKPIRPYSLGEQMFLGREIASAGADLVHFPQFNVPVFHAPFFVVTFHDLIYYHFPEDCPSWLAHVAVKKVMKAATRNAGRIITTSQSTKDDLVRTFGTDPARIDVTPLGSMDLPPDTLSEDRVQRARESAGVDGPYIFYTGNHSPHKNLVTLFRALGILNRNGSNLRLVITGKKDRHTPQMESAARHHGVDRQVIFAGFVPDEHLFPLYAGAEALVFPSRYEGFGLPPLEAFACGTPVIASNASSIPEVLGDAAVLLDPLDAEGFAEAIRRVRSDPETRRALVARGHERLKLYSWTETARKTVDIFRRMVN
jgi:glycosyltransferase involved in cell wall biosynthesis